MSEKKNDFDKELVELADKLCKKPKKFCDLCDSKLGPPAKEELANHKSRVWCSWVQLKHPKFKSKNFKLCGHCYGEVLRAGK